MRSCFLKMKKKLSTSWPVLSVSDRYKVFSSEITLKFLKCDPTFKEKSAKSPVLSVLSAISFAFMALASDEEHKNRLFHTIHLFQCWLWQNWKYGGRPIGFLTTLSFNPVTTTSKIFLAHVHLWQISQWFYVIWHCLQPSFPLNWILWKRNHFAMVFTRISSPAPICSTSARHD